MYVDGCLFLRELQVLNFQKDLALTRVIFTIANDSSLYSTVLERLLGGCM